MRENLYRARVQYGIKRGRACTSKELAIMAGIHPNYYGQVERGTVKGSRFLWDTLSGILGVPAEELKINNES